MADSPPPGATSAAAKPADGTVPELVITVVRLNDVSAENMLILNGGYAVITTRGWKIASTDIVDGSAIIRLDQADL